MIRRASAEMTTEIMSIWSQSFNISAGEMKMFFMHRWRPSQALVSIVKGRAAAVAYTLPCRIILDGMERNALYLCGGAVLPKLRNRGLFWEILNEVKRISEQEGVILVADIRDESMRHFLSTIGFVTLGGYKRARFSAEANAESVTCESLHADIYEYLRNEAYARNGFVRWANEDVAYSIRKNVADGGVCDLLRFEGKAYPLFAKADGGVLHVHETTMPSDMIRKLSGSICEIYGVSAVECELHPSDAADAAVERSSIVYGCRGMETGWLRLTPM